VDLRAYGEGRRDVGRKGTKCKEREQGRGRGKKTWESKTHTHTHTHTDETEERQGEWRGRAADCYYSSEGERERQDGRTIGYVFFPPHEHVL